jgi:glycerol-3-phosphate acyltransferase PlsX
VIKSHGGTDAEGIAYAIDIGYNTVRHALLARIGETLSRDQGQATPPRLAQGAAT